MLAALKKAAAALRDADIPFAVGGGFAAWARSGPATDHDVDLFLRRADADRALEVLEAAGMKPERPPEGWLLKAWDDDVLVDLIFAPAGTEVDDDLLARAEVRNVDAMPLPVAAPEDVLVTKLLALSEHNLAYEGPLEVARSLREQLDWHNVAARTASSPYARAFLYLARELGVAPPA